MFRDIFEDFVGKDRLRGLDRSVTNQVCCFSVKTNFSWLCPFVDFFQSLNLVSGLLGLHYSLQEAYKCRLQFDGSFFVFYNAITVS